MDTFTLDFEKTSDTHPHEKSKMFRLGIGGKTLKWTDSLLFYRKQRVVVNGETSGWAPAGADKSKIFPLIHWVSKIIFFHLPSEKNLLAQHFAPTSFRDD